MMSFGDWVLCVACFLAGAACALLVIRASTEWRYIAETESKWQEEAEWIRKDFEESLRTGDDKTGNWRYTK